MEASDKNYVEPRVGAESRKPAKKSTGSDKLITVYLKESRRVGSPCAACYCYHEATSYSFIILTYFYKEVICSYWLVQCLSLEDTPPPPPSSTAIQLTP